MTNASEIIEPLISVVLPTYNVERYIENCLNSCAKQTLTNVEFIIVDDCGSDSSISIAERFSIADSRFKILRSTENVGTFRARKKGVEQSNGKYILFLDPDDSLKHDALEKLYNQTRLESADIIFYSVEISPKQPITTLPRQLPKNNINPETILKCIFQDTPNMSWGTPGKMYSKELAINAFEELSCIQERLTYAEDVLFLFVAAALSASCRSYPENLYIYNKNPESITEATSTEAKLNHCRQIDTVIKYLLKLSKSPKLILINGASLQAVVDRISRSLNSDKALMKRHLHDPTTGKSLYLKSVFCSYKFRRSHKDLIRIVLYISTFSKFKF